MPCIIMNFLLPLSTPFLFLDTRHFTTPPSGTRHEKNTKYFGSREESEVVGNFVFSRMQMMGNFRLGKS